LANATWDKLVSQLDNDKKELLHSLLNPDFSKIDFPALKGQKMATRDSNGKILNAIAAALPGFIGGSADLGPSNKTELKGFGDYPNGKNMHFGIREHAMAAICNAYARYGIFIPFSATFFIFSDYLKAGARLAALMGLKHYFIWTHDSIGVGEDGPTHEPIEQLSTFRAMPNFYTFRPADGAENVECWKVALNLNAPCAFVCSRQGLNPLDEAKFGSVANGAYLIKESKNPQITLVASGSEVGLCLEAANLLENSDIGVNVVSAPCFDLLCEQESSYIKRIFAPQTKVLAVEAATALEWYKFANNVFGMSSFGASAPADELFKYFGFSATNIANVAKEMLK
jgi:transketolase